jgi:hypothetical protein
MSQDNQTLIPEAFKASRRAILAAAPAVAVAALTAGTVANAVAIGTAKADETDPDAELIELARQLVDITPDVEASVRAVKRADAEASRATMVRLGMDPDVPGARWGDKDTPRDVFESRMAVWRQVREELGNEHIEAEHDRLQSRADQLFEGMLALPIRTLRGAALVGVGAALTRAISHYWREPLDDLDWPERVIRLFIENLHFGLTGEPFCLQGKAVTA